VTRRVTESDHTLEFRNVMISSPKVFVIVRFRNRNDRYDFINDFHEALSKLSVVLCYVCDFSGNEVKIADFSPFEELRVPLSGETVPLRSDLEPLAGALEVVLQHYAGHPILVLPHSRIHITDIIEQLGSLTNHANPTHTSSPT
jgi:hypothetical protein